MKFHETIIWQHITITPWVSVLHPRGVSSTRSNRFQPLGRDTSCIRSVRNVGDMVIKIYFHFGDIGGHSTFWPLSAGERVPLSPPRIQSKPLNIVLYWLLRRYTSHLRCRTRLGRGDLYISPFWWHWWTFDSMDPFRWWKGPPLKPPLCWKTPCYWSYNVWGYSINHIRVHTYMSGVVILSYTVFGWNMRSAKNWQK